MWFDFSDLSTLFTDAARTTAVAADGDSIGGVTDKSGSGNHASQSTSGKRPTYKTGILNGRSAALFTSANLQYLSANNLASVFSGSDLPLSIFVVFKMSTFSAGSQIFSLARSSNANPLFALDADFSSTSYRFVRRSDSGTVVVASGGTPDTLATLLTSSFTGTLTNLWKNTTQVITNVSQDVPTITLDRCSIGARDTNGAQSTYLNGYIMELGAYDSALSTTDIGKLQTYAASRWGSF